MSEPRGWTLTWSPVNGLRAVSRKGDAHPAETGETQIAVIEAAPVEAELERLRAVETAAKTLLATCSYAYVDTLPELEDFEKAQDALSEALSNPAEPKWVGRIGEGLPGKRTYRPQYDETNTDSAERDNADA